VARAKGFAPDSSVLAVCGIVNLASRLYNRRLVCAIPPVNPPTLTAYDKHHRFPVESISHSVWLYSRCCLSSRDVEERLCAHGIMVTYEAIRTWCRTLGQPYANQRRHRRSQPGEKWQLEEIVLTIHGERHDLWRAIDQDGHVLDILAQRRRHKASAKTFFCKLLKGLMYVPRVISTNQLKKL
jgi:putative transposase